MKKKSKRKRYKKAGWIFSLAVLLIIGAVFYLKKTVFKPFTPDTTVYIYIDEKRDFDDIVHQLKEKAGLPSEKIFNMLAKRMNYLSNIKTGCYAVKNGMTMIELIRILRAGMQTPVNLTFNNIRTKTDLVSRLSQQLMLDSVSLMNALNDLKKVEKFGFDTCTVVCMFIPNTYEVYWDIGVDKLLSRMKREYDIFWNAERKAKAQKIGLTPVEVSILASIVEEEATYPDEYPVIAGLYLNRLHKGMKLEADPTVKFAVGDFSLQRILFKHLELDSPYNTYKYVGLPPGPIRIPSVEAIDAVLSPQQHGYLFMCAKDDLSGRHNFASTHTEHARNAVRYQRALDERKIY